MYRNFYSVNDMPKPLHHREEKTIEPVSCTHPDVSQKKGNTTTLKKNNSILGGLETDDLLLIAVILLLLADNCEDTLLLLAIGFVFISGMK